MLTVAVPKRNKLQNIIVLTPKDGHISHKSWSKILRNAKVFGAFVMLKRKKVKSVLINDTCLSELS